MHEYDTALKRILMRPGSALLTELTGCDRLRWLNVELPNVRNERVDLLGEKPDGSLVQIEFQSGNERNLPIRMGEYLFAIGRAHRRLPRQIVLYVGEASLRMKDKIEGPGYSFQFHLADIRDFDGERLLASKHVGDNILAILTQPEASLRPCGEFWAGSRKRLSQPAISCWVSCLSWQDCGKWEMRSGRKPGRCRF